MTVERDRSDRLAVAHRGAVAAIGRFREEMADAGGILGRYRECEVSVEELSLVYSRAILSLSIATRCMVVLESELVVAAREEDGADG